MNTRDSIDKRNLRSDKTSSHWMLFNEPKKSDKKLTDIQETETDEAIEKEEVLDPFASRSKVLRSPILSKKEFIPEESEKVDEDKNIIEKNLNITVRKDKKTSCDFTLRTPEKVDTSYREPKVDFTSEESNSKSDNSFHSQESIVKEPTDKNKSENLFTETGTKGSSFETYFSTNPRKKPTFRKTFSLNDLFSNQSRDFRKNSENSINSNLFNWSLSGSSAMAPIPIREITDLIREYDGNDDTLNSFIKNTEKLWIHIADYSDEDKNRFMLILQLKLINKAAEATKETEFDNWENVKKDLLENINPQTNIERAELKLTTVSQERNENLEDYAKRVESLLHNLNKSFSVVKNDEVIAVESDRKARRSFENGISNRDLRNKAIARGSKTLKETIDYVIEQELRQFQFKQRDFEEKYCGFCKFKGHTYQECRKKNANRNASFGNENKKEVVCFKCNKKGHYANECNVRNDDSKPGPSNPRKENQNQDRFPGNRRRTMNNVEAHPSNQKKTTKNIRFCENVVPLDDSLSDINDEKN